METKPKQVKNGTRTYLINGDFIKFHTVFKDGTEIVEEYGIYSEELESRRVKKIGMTGKEQWITEIGEEIKPRSNDEFLIRENDNNPLFIRKDTPKEFQWRIRNLKGDADNFMVECDKDKQQIVIRTKNKKYYKRFNIPDLERLNIKLDENLMKVNLDHRRADRDGRGGSAGDPAGGGRDPDGAVCRAVCERSAQRDA